MEFEGVVKILFAFFLIVLITSIILDFTMPLGFEILGVMKPITLLQYSGFITFALFLSLTKEFWIKIDRRWHELLMILAFFIILGTFFEVMWAFNYWFANYQLSVLEGEPKNAETLDAVDYRPDPDLEKVYVLRADNLSLNKSAKKDTLYLFMAIYFVYFIHGVRKK